MSKTSSSQPELSLQKLAAAIPDPIYLALSGGIDSLWLYHFLVTRAGRQVTPVFFAHPGVYPEEASMALAVLQQDRGMRLYFSPEEMQRVWAGPLETRCYRCKLHFFSRLRALTGGRATLGDGSHLGDDPRRRPGMRALAELGVVSPLRLSGWDKSMIRRQAREAGLKAWDQPSRACLLVDGEL